jgi:hypothetical protein
MVEAISALLSGYSHQTTPEVHLPAAIRLRHGDGGGEVVEAARLCTI